MCRKNRVAQANHALASEAPFLHQSSTVLPLEQPGTEYGSAATLRTHEVR
jgi:hypothetical protein